MSQKAGRLILLCSHADVLIGGDDFKSGQTKMKSVLVDFLVGAGIKPMSIVSYNHLGNNDGMNLSAPQTFRSKEISKSNVVSALVILTCTESPQTPPWWKTERDMYSATSAPHRINITYLWGDILN